MDNVWTEFLIIGSIPYTYEAEASLHKVLAAAFKNVPPGYALSHQKEICEYHMPSVLQKINKEAEKKNPGSWQCVVTVHASISMCKPMPSAVANYECETLRQYEDVAVSAKESPD